MMTGKVLKQWALTIPDEAIIEVKRYDWEAIDREKIRAIYICQPVKTMDDVCNAEQVSA
jgi:hypothetical protein